MRPSTARVEMLRTIASRPHGDSRMLPVGIRISAGYAASVDRLMLRAFECWSDGAFDASLPETTMQTADERNIFLSTMPATSRDRHGALAVVGVSAVLFACAVPFAGVPLAPVPAFVASYQSALAINDLITAVLLFSQFAILRSRALLLLASGYLFTAAAAIVHALTFPGLFAPTGLARRRSADHGLALHDLARRISAAGARLCAAERQAMAAPRYGGRPAGRSSAASSRSASRCRVATWVVTARHDLLPITAERRALHAHHDRRRVDGMVSQPRGAAGAVVSATAFRARRLAHGRDVRLAVRHRVVGDPQRGQIRSRLLCSAGSTGSAPRASCWRCC